VDGAKAAARAGGGGLPRQFERVDGGVELHKGGLVRVELGLELRHGSVGLRTDARTQRGQ
jgi:hypothetical protein